MRQVDQQSIQDTQAVASKLRLRTYAFSNISAGLGGDGVFCRGISQAAGGNAKHWKTVLIYNHETKITVQKLRKKICCNVQRIFTKKILFTETKKKKKPLEMVCEFYVSGGSRLVEKITSSLSLPVFIAGNFQQSSWEITMSYKSQRCLI